MFSPENCVPWPLNSGTTKFSPTSTASTAKRAASAFRTSRATWTRWKNDEGCRWPCVGVEAAGNVGWAAVGHARMTRATCRARHERHPMRAMLLCTRAGACSTYMVQCTRADTLCFWLSIAQRVNLIFFFFFKNKGLEKTTTNSARNTDPGERQKTTHNATKKGWGGQLRGKNKLQIADGKRDAFQNPRRVLCVGLVNLCCRVNEFAASTRSAW